MASLDPLRKPSLDSLAPSDRSSRKSSDYEGSKYDEDDDDDTTTTWSNADADHTRLLRNRPSDDLESQTRRRPATAQSETSSQPVEYSVPTSKKLFYLGLYFAFNLGLTLSNKALLGHASFPWLLTFSHTTATSIGCALMLAAGRLQLTKLSTRDNLTLVAFSILFTLNIATSNISLAAVSVPFHQVMRSTCPVVTILIYRLVYHRTYSHITYLSMLPLIVGVALATLGSYSFTPAGFLLTLLGVVLASIKTVATNRLMTGALKLSAMELLLRMSPLAAAQCLVYAAVSGEVGAVFSALTTTTTTPDSSSPSASAVTLTPLFLLGLLANAAVAFALNGVSFQTNKVAGALTMSVCGNLKQCFTILLGIVLFHVQVSAVNGVGMVIALGGAALYSKVELEMRKKKTEVVKVESEAEVAVPLISPPPRGASLLLPVVVEEKERRRAEEEKEETASSTLDPTSAAAASPAAVR